jgi:hypothetical protein
MMVISSQNKDLVVLQQRIQIQKQTLNKEKGAVKRKTDYQI